MLPLPARPVEMGFMTCYQHPNMHAAARCTHCGKEICAVCVTHVNGQIVCRDCAEVLRSQPAPAVAEPRPEAEAPIETPARAEAPAAAAPEAPKEAPAPSAGESSGMPVPIVPSSITPVARSAPPVKKMPDPGAGGEKAKEPLLSAALSLILPGVGQAYNGQTGKGLVLATIYIGSIAIIVSGMIVAALAATQNNMARSACCCCLPLFIVPMIVLVYAIYDAYNVAEKINSEPTTKEWP
jgi:hypothetical protein